MPFLARLAMKDAGLRGRLGIAVCLLCISKSLGLVVPMLFKQAVDALAPGAGGINVAVKAIILSGVCKAIASAANELRSVSFTPVAQEAGRKVALAIFSHIINLDIEFHMARRTGALSRIIERGTRSVTMVFRAVVFTFLPTVVELLLVCYLLSAAFSPILVLIVMTTFAVYVAWTVVWTSQAAQLRKEVNRLDNLATGATVDTLINVETIQHFNNSSVRSALYNDLLRDYQHAAVRTEEAACTLNAGQAITMAIGISATLATAATLSGASITPGDLVLVNGLLVQLWAPLSFLGFFYRELRQSLVDMEAMFDVLNIMSKVQDGPLQLPQQEGGVEVEFKDVRFGYHANREVLRGVTLHIRRGENVAIVGPSGSGKSTLLKVLLRMYDPTSGAVLLDQQDSRNLTLSSIRASAAVVPQDTALFNDTLLNNIAFGRPGVTKEEIMDAAEAAQLHETVCTKFPEKYATVVGERGLKLSGGEKQRVAIARAFVRKPRLVVCDEATSALDSKTEQGIQASLQGLSKGRTCITVAHRLSTVKDCDRIIVMRDGKVAEEGSHMELLRKNGIYTSMWALQQAEDKFHELELAEEEAEAERDLATETSPPSA